MTDNDAITDPRRRATPEAAITSALVMSGVEFAKWAPERAMKVLQALREIGWRLSEIPPDHPDHPSKQRIRDNEL